MASAVGSPKTGADIDEMRSLLEAVNSNAAVVYRPITSKGERAVDVPVGLRRDPSRVGLMRNLLTPSASPISDQEAPATRVSSWPLPVRMP